MLPLDDNATGFVIAQALLHQHLPEAMALERKIVQGNVINNFDLQHLQEQLLYCHEVLPYFKHHPQYSAISTTLIKHYHHIIQATLNDELLKHNNTHISDKVIRGEMLVEDND